MNIARVTTDGLHIVTASGSIHDTADLYLQQLIGAGQHILDTPEALIIAGPGPYVRALSPDLRSLGYSTLTFQPAYAFYWNGKVHLLDYLANPTSDGLRFPRAAESVQLETLMTLPLPSAADPFRQLVLPELGGAYATDDGVLLLPSPSNGTLFRWSMSARTYLPSFPLPHNAAHFAYSPTNQRLYFAMPAGRIYYLDLKQGRVRDFAENLSYEVIGIAPTTEYVFVTARFMRYYAAFDHSGQLAAGRTFVPFGLFGDHYIVNEAQQVIYHLVEVGGYPDLSATFLSGSRLDRHVTLGTGRNNVRSRDQIPPLRASPDMRRLLIGSGYLFDAEKLIIIQRLFQETLEDAVLTEEHAYGLFRSGDRFTIEKRSLDTGELLSRYQGAGIALRIFLWKDFLVVVLAAEEGFGFKYLFAHDVSEIPSPPVPFRRGDANRDGRIDVSDAARILVALYLALEPSLFAECPDAADANADGLVDSADAIYLLNYLFLLANPPPLPRSCYHPPLSFAGGCRIYGPCP